MPDARGVIDFLALEAHEYLERLDAWLARAARAVALGEPAPDAAPVARDARALRGAATMARHDDLAALAGAVERAGAAIAAGHLAPSAVALDVLVAAVDAFKQLLRSVATWSDAEARSVRAHVAEVERCLTAAPPARPADVVLPIRALAPTDGAPQVVHRAPAPPDTADRRFREAAGPLAAALRRLIAEARPLALAGDPGDAARATLGADLGAALRDLRELAESYDIAPVARLAAAREAPLAALDARALELVDGAAVALLDSAAQARARRTPAAAQAAVAPAASAPAVEEAPSAPERRTQAPQPWRPPTGAALVALLETGITRFGGLGALVDDGTPEPDDARVIAPPDVPAPGDAVEAAPIVPVEELLYRGAAALARAREVRDRLRAAHGAVPDAALLAELYDLLDLAAE